MSLVFFSVSVLLTAALSLKETCGFIDNESFKALTYSFLATKTRCLEVYRKSESSESSQLQPLFDAQELLKQFDLLKN